MFLSQLYQQETIKTYQSLLAKEPKDQFIRINIKQKVKSKNTTNEYRYFLEPNFVEVNRLFILLYTNKDYKI